MEGYRGCPRHPAGFQHVLLALGMRRGAGEKGLVFSLGGEEEEGASPCLASSDPYPACNTHSTPTLYPPPQSLEYPGLQILKKQRYRSTSGYREDIARPLILGRQKLPNICGRDSREERGHCSFSRSLQKLAVLFKMISFPRLGLGSVL